MCHPALFQRSGRELQATAVGYVLAFLLLVVGSLESRAELGLAREHFGVWDREGLHAIADYPYARGQSLDMSWEQVNPARNTFNWSEINQKLQSAEAQNQAFTCKVSPIDQSAPTKSMPAWMFSAGVPSFSESGTGAALYTYGYYLDPEFKIYFEEMVNSLATYLRTNTSITANQRSRIAFVRVDTGCTGDEEPYENPSLVSATYQIDNTAWQAHRRWVFELYRKAFQEGPGPIIPLLFVTVEPPDQQTQWDWILDNVKGGFGIKHGGQLRGYHLTESESNVTVFKPLAVDSDFKFFSRNEMDQTWQYPYFNLNRPLSMYWAALEQLNVGMSVWDWSGSCMEGASANGFTFVGEFFNKWAAELDPATAGGGFCVFHDGLDSSDTSRFPENTTYGGNASKGNTLRYTKICEQFAAQGAAMDHLEAATWGQVAQRNPPEQPPGGQTGFNDAGWQIHPGNYDRFITQINPNNTSKGLWRVRGPLTTTSHPYDRFARRSNNSSGQNTMYFNINDNLLPSLGQRVQLNVTYLDKGTGQFRLVYDAVSSAQKTAFTVTKTNTNEWLTQSIEVTDWRFGNRGTNGADLQLVNVATDAANPDTIFHGIEVIKLADVSVGIIGQGTVTGRNNAAAFTPLPSSVMEGQRLELQATAAPGWVFAGWSGALTGTNPNPFLFPTKDTRLTATFTQTSTSASSTDDFNSGTWTGGSGWSGNWTPSGTTTFGNGTFVELNGTTTGGAQIIRTLATPLTNVTLSFDWDLDRLVSGEKGDVWIFDDATSAWVNVWSRDFSQNGADAQNANDANFVNSGNIVLSASRRVSQIRFSVTSSVSNHRFYIDNVSISGTGNSPPAFSVDPIGKSPAANGVAYAGTLAGDASDSGGNPLTFTKLSKISGGTDWLTVSSSGALGGTPTSDDVGLNRWTVQVSSSGGTDTAILLIDVSAPGPNPPTGLSYPSPPVYTNGTAIANISPASGGGSVMRYVASPRLPKGLYLNSTTGVISGTPMEAAATASYTITATNTDGSTTTNLTITVNDIPPTSLTYSSNPATYKKGTAITANTPSNTGGTVVSYAVSPALPAGLTLDGVTGVISGTPTVASPTPVIYQITATNSGGSTFCDVSITIEDVYLNNTAITINDGATAPFISSPYPSSIVVPTTAGTISKVTVQLVGFSHARQNDVDVLLVGPQGQKVILMSDVGGTAAASNADLTFDDAGSNILSTTTSTIPTGTYQPFNNGTTDNFPTPAPAAPYGTTLAAFNTTNPTGTWSLYVVDDRAANTGSLSGGWNLKFEMAASVAPPSSLSYSSNPATYTKGTAITNNTPTSGGGAVDSYAVSPALPAGLTLNTSTGVISGTPSAVTATASYTVTATNSGGSTTASVSITVNDVAPSTLAYSSNPATYTKGTAITANTPTSSGGTVVSYAVSPALPAGLTLNTSTGIISGTPSAVTATASYTVTASNSGGSTTASVSITVNDVAPSTLAYSSNPATYTKGTAIAANTPTSSGGAVVSYAVSPALPTGLTLNTSTGIISGTPSAVTTTASYTVTATNSGGSTTASVSITVNDVAPSTLAYSSNPATYTKGTAIAGNTPTSSGGAVVSYAVSPALPTGLSLNTSTGVISGTPTAVTATASYTVTATNSGGSATASVSVTVNDVAPSSLAYSSNPATYTKGTAITNNTPTSSGGAVVSYAVSPALPTGLTLNTSTGVISGTPSAVTATASYTVTATNSGGSTTASVSITVNDVAPTTLAYSSNPATYTKDTVIAGNTPTSSGGTVVSYAVSPALPTGLTLDTSTGVISGTPSVVTAAASYTVTATNSGGSTTASVSITVNDVAPSTLAYSSNPATYTTGTAITANTPTSGGGAVVSYAVSPALPTGLSLDTSTGVISGTPSAVTATASYTVTASNSGGSTTASVSITVNDVAPTTLAYSSNPATYTTGTAITANTPTSGGGAVDSYAVSPALPEGLTLNTTTGVISGTPSAVTAAASYTVTATNSGGSTTASVSVNVVSPYTAWSDLYNLVQGPDGDDDGDGNSNSFEFVAGLIPTDAGSVFKTTPASVPSQPNHLAISFGPIVGGRTYTVKGSDSLSPANWQPLSDFTSSDVGNVRTVTDNAATGAKKFYRVEISIP